MDKKTALELSRETYLEISELPEEAILRAIEVEDCPDLKRSTKNWDSLRQMYWKCAACEYAMQTRPSHMEHRPICLFCPIWEYQKDWCVLTNSPFDLFMWAETVEAVREAAKKIVEDCETALKRLEEDEKGRSHE